jgi:regulation of enolase protein 1 (concanavalin A-like superfamily)
MARDAPGSILGSSMRSFVTYLSILAAFLITLQSASAVVALSASGGQTNHPVIFVHGFGAHMTTEWGAVPTPPAAGGCNLSDNHIIWNITKNISHGSSWVDYEYKHGLVVTASMVDCDNHTVQIYPEIGKSVSLGNRGWHSCTDEVWWGFYDPCAQPLRDNTTTSHTGDDITGTFHLTGVGNYSSFHKTYTLSATDQKKLKVALDAFVTKNSGGVVFDDGTVGYPPASENLMDRPIAYLPSSTPWQIKNALALSSPPADNGLYFFNAKKNIAGGLAQVSPLQPVLWAEALGGRPGQAQQLYRTIVGVMDAYYVPKGVNWRTSSSATIDLVGYSQGALTIRAMVSYLQSHPNENDFTGNPLSTVLNRLNRLVGLDSPHFGSALITNPARMTNGISHPQSVQPLTFPVLGREILNLTQTNPGVPVLEIHEPDLLDINFWDNAGLNLTVNGDTYLGPYHQTSGDINVFGCSSNCSWFDCSFNVPAALTCWQTYKWKFDISEMLAELSGQTGVLKTKLNNMRANASALAWSDAGPGEGQLIQAALTFQYPRRTNGSNIDMVNVTSRSAGALMTALPDKIAEAIYPICIDQVDQHTDFGDMILLELFSDVNNTCARIADKFSSGLALRNFAKDFDADWSTRGDFVVENFSQNGALASGDYNPGSNLQFKNQSIAKKEVSHFAVPFLEDDPSRIAHNQACDVLSALASGCTLPPPPPAGSVEKSDASLAPERMDVLETKAVTNRGQPVYKMRLRYTRKAPDVMQNLNLTYYFKENPANSPTVTMVPQSGWTAQVRQVQGAMYAVDIAATGLGLARNAVTPEIELTFSNGNGQPWNPVDDWSSALKGTWQNTLRIVNVPRAGESFGLKPDMEDPSVTDFVQVARAASKERSGLPNQSQPYITVENSGKETLTGFKVWYVVRAPTPFQIREYFRTGQSQSTITQIGLGNGYYAIQVAYPNWVLTPGQKIEEITFELNHYDWAAWDLSDDPSFHAETPQSLQFNGKIMVFSNNNSLIGGEDLSALWETATSVTAAHAEAKNSSSFPDYKVLDFRIKNAGGLPVNGFEMRYRILSENGAIPKALFVNAQNCTSHLADLGAGRYEATFNCPYAKIEPGQYWPQPGAAQGLRLEIQYGNGVVVDLANDPSFVGIGTDWNRAQAVLVYDTEGSLIFGSAPWDDPDTHDDLPSPWISQDVGSVGKDGSAIHATGTFTVKGSGADIWGAADGFRFVYQAVNGNAEITARVSSVQNTDPWAKAGVMIRETLGANAKYMAMVVTPSNGLSFQYRSTTGGSSGSAGAAGAAPKWVRVRRVGNTLTGYYSADGVTWTQAGTQQIPLNSVIYVGMAASSHNNTALSQAVFGNVTVTSLNANPWTKTDIGSPGVTGSTTVTGISGTVSGSGADIWGSADQFTFVNRALLGDGSITARIMSVQNTNAWAKAGVMIRESLAANSKHALIVVSAASGLSFQRRTATGGASVSSTVAGSAPSWVRLTRLGDTFTASSSGDGVNWSVVGSASIPMAANIYVGLAVTSHNNAVAATAVYEGIQVIE